MPASGIYDEHGRPLSGKRVVDIPILSGIAKSIYRYVAFEGRKMWA